jgi:molybdopterin-containing oxidoreductase family membrane subunit
MAGYGWWTLFANVAGIILPIVIIAIPKTRTPNLIALVSFIMVIALWVKRYLIIVPTLESPLVPVQDTRPEFVKYSATWPEWALTFAGIATFLLFFTLMSKFVTVVPVSELVDPKAHHEHAKDNAKEQVKKEEIQPA